MSTAPNARVRRVHRLAASITLAAVLIGVDSAVVAGARAQPAAVPSPAVEGVIGLKYGSYGAPVRALQQALDPRRRRREVRSGRTLRLGDPRVGEGVPGVQGASGDGRRGPGDRAGARSGQRSHTE